MNGRLAKKTRKEARKIAETEVGTMLKKYRDLAKRRGVMVTELLARVKELEDGTDSKVS